VIGFTISRDVGQGGSKANPLTVYYAVGGSAEYLTDYALNPAPAGWPASLPWIFLRILTPLQLQLSQPLLALLRVR